MCGIAGTVGFAPMAERMPKMLGQMMRRGPDGSGTWTDGDRVELGHRRLSIIDLSTGQQPQVSPDGRFVLVLNGEIYNYPELRPGLEQRGWRFRTTSDTEVLLAGLVLQGPEFVSETVGMFAFALWDSREKVLLLCRDRMGIKPLYYAQPSSNKLVFASELKAILSLDEFTASGGGSRRLNPDAFDAFLALRYVPGPDTMIEGIHKFPQAHWAVFKEGRLEFKRYWQVRFDSFESAGTHGRNAPSGGGRSDQEIEGQFADLLRDAVRLCLRADVECGSFLSGGVDSATVTGLMAQGSRRPIHTYSIGFGSPQDELSDAARIAEHFGTIHTPLRLEPSDFGRLPEVVRLMDEPFADPIVLAMSLLAQKARQDVKVILTGEGADELLAGYVHHPHFLAVQKYLPHLPGLMMKIASAGVRWAPVRWMDRAFAYPASLGKKGRARLARFLSAVGQKKSDGYLAYISLFETEERRDILSADLKAQMRIPPLFENRVRMFMPGDGRERQIDEILEAEYNLWLPDNILFKQDKTLMAHSVEGRVPFCDHRLVEFVSRLPMRFKLAKGVNKIVLRKAARALFPKASLPGPKKAFMVPMSGESGRVQMELARDVLTSAACLRRGIFDARAVKRLMDEYPESPFLAGKQLMALTMLELWMENVLHG